MMDHPNIARVFDAGAGTPITPGLNVPVTQGRLIRISGACRIGWPGFAGGIGTAHWTVSTYLGAGLITVGGIILLTTRSRRHQARA